jgi:outer membrane immunogenic protein
MSAKHVIAPAAAMAAALSVGGASAADLSMAPVMTPTAPPAAMAAPAAFNWGGLYMGVHGGGGWATSDTCVLTNDFGDYGCSPFDSGYNEIDMSGPYVGAHIGYNFVPSGNLLFGIEADINWAGIDGQGDQYWSTSTIGTHVHDSVDWFGTVRGRLGVVMGDWLPYVTGGFAYGQGTRESSGYTFGAPPPNGTPYTYLGAAYGPFTASASHSGWTAGAGLEKAIANGWSVKGEYKYVDLGRADYSINDPASHTVLGIDMKIHTFEIGLSRHF